MPAPRRDFEQLKRGLERWLAGKCSTKAASLRVEGLRGPSETGFSSDTLLFDCEWEENGTLHRQPMVARLEPQGVTVFPRYDMERQFRLLHWLSEQGSIRVPRVYWYEGAREVLGSPFFVMEYVDGRVPSDNPPYHVVGWLHEFRPEERRQLWMSGLQAMAAVHTLDVAPLLGTIFPAAPNARTYLEEQLEEYRQFIAWGLQAERYPLLARAEQWLRRNAPEREQVRLCWGDARIGNQLFRHTECVALLDWEMARIGDPQQDLAWFLALDRCFSEGLGVQPLAGLGGREESIAAWERTTGLRADRIEYYEVLALYKFTAIMARVITQLKHYEVFPQESDMDVHNLASITLERTLAALGE